MAKEKRMTLEQNKRELTFYYELIGVGAILLSLIALARLGLVGYYIMMAFRIIFGDWYFAFLLALLLFGIYCLFRHQPLNVKNMRSIGVILLMVSILTFSHFPMHKYISQFGSNYLKMTFSLYLDYFKNYQEGMIVGGGVIGSLFFYLFYTLFSSAGTLVIVLFLGSVGVSFSFNKTIGESLNLFKNIIVKIFSIFLRFGKTLKYGIEVNSKGHNKLERVPTKNTKRITIDILMEPERHNYIITEEKHATSLKKLIASILNNMNIFYQSVSYVVAEHITTILIDTTVSINLDKLYMKLKATLTERFLITKDIDSPKIKIEIDNVDVNTIYLKTILLRQGKYENNWKLPIGIDTNNDLVEIDLDLVSSILIIEERQELVYQMMMGYLMLFKIKMLSSDYELKLFDLKGQFGLFEKKEYYQQPEELIKLKKDLDWRLEAFSNSSCNDLEEYNHKNKENMSRKIILMFNFEQLFSDKRHMETMLYLLQVGKKCGYYFIVHYNYSEILSSKIDSLFGVKIIGKHSNINGEHYLGINPEPYLYDEEAFYMYRDELFRFSLATIKEEELNKLLKD